MVLHTNISAIDSESKLAQVLHPLDPAIYLLDCGCWTDNMRFFGAISGREVMLVRVAPTNSIVGQESRDAVIGDTFKKLIRAIGRIHPSSRENPQTQSSELGPSYQCEILEHRYTRPFDWRDERTGRAVDETNPLYVFIPDTHIGVLDSADNFADRMSPDALVNLRLLSGVVRGAKEAGAVVVQMGDFLDVWEAEAAIEVAKFQPAGGQSLDNGAIYFGKPKSSLSRGDFLRDWGSEPEREHRTQRAVKAIVSRWQAFGGSDFEYLIASGTMVFVRGNHDYERFALPAGSLQSWLPASSLENFAGRHWAFPTALEYRDCLWAKGHWASEHGHYHDATNDTSSHMRVQTILPNVFGKAVTYWYARCERKKSGAKRVYLYPAQTSEGIEQERRTEHPEELPFWSGATSYKVSQEPLLMRGYYYDHWDRAELLEDGYARDAADIYVAGEESPGGAGLAGYLTVAAASWRVADNAVANYIQKMFSGRMSSFDLTYGANGAGMPEIANFDDMRFRIIERVREAVKAMNKTYDFFDYSREIVGGKTRRNEFVIRYESKDGTRPPLQVPFVVLVHGHTHQPMIVDLRFELFVSPLPGQTYQTTM